MRANQVNNLTMLLGNLTIALLPADTETSNVAVDFMNHGRANSLPLDATKGVFLSGELVDGPNGLAVLPHVTLADGKAILYALYCEWNVPGAAYYVRSSNQVDIDADGNQDPDTGEVFIWPNLGSGFDVPPDEGNAHTFVGYIVVKNNSGGGWVIGTDNWDAAGITSVVTNVVVKPDRPIFA